MNKLKSPHPFLSHGAASRIAKERKLTATQIYNLGHKKASMLRAMRALRKEEVVKELAEIKAKLAEGAATNPTIEPNTPVITQDKVAEVNGDNTTRQNG